MPGEFDRQLRGWTVEELRKRFAGRDLAHDIRRLIDYPYRGDELDPKDRGAIPGRLGSAIRYAEEEITYGPFGFAYLPLSDTAQYGWGTPYTVDPPLGTVQAGWLPGNRIYRIGDFDGETLTVTHDTDQTASGMRWWSNETTLVSWVAIAGWESIASSAGSVPSGRLPIFEAADVLTWSPANCDQIFCLGHDGTYLYIGYRYDWELYFARAAITLGSGAQSPTWTTIGPCTTKGSLLDNWIRWADFNSTFDEWVANASAGKTKAGWNKKITYWREYDGTLNWSAETYTAAVSQDAVDGVGEDTLSKTWTEANTYEDLPASFVPRTPPFSPNNLEGGILPTNAVASYSISSTILSWYDRDADTIHRKRFELDIGYEHCVPSTDGIGWAQRDYDALGIEYDPQSPVNIYYCNPGCVDSHIGINVTGKWFAKKTLLDLDVTARIVVDGDTVISVPIATQDYESESWGVNNSYIQTVTEVDDLDCDIAPGTECGYQADPDDVLAEFGAISYYTPESSVTAVNEEQRTCANPSAWGDNGDAKGDIHSIVTDVWHRVVAGGAQQIGSTTAERVWTVRESDQTELLNLEYDELQRRTQFYVSAPSIGEETTTAVIDEDEWDDYFADVVSANIYGQSNDYRSLFYQPCVRLPGGGYFCAMSQPDRAPYVPTYTGSWYYAYSFSGGDLVTATSMTGTNPRFSAYGWDVPPSTYPTPIVSAGLENLVGVIE